MVVLNDSAFQLALNWLAIIVTLGFVVNRLYIRMVCRWGGWQCLTLGRAWGGGDICVVLAWIFTIQRGIDNIIIFKESVQTVREGKSRWGPETERWLLKLDYVSVAVYWIPMYCIKVAMLFTYNDFLPQSRRWLLITSGGLCFSGCFVTVGFFLLGCLPISMRWDQSSELEKCAESRFIPYYVIISTFHIVTDILVFAIPFYILRFIMDATTKQQRISIGVMFAIGVVSVACSFIMAFSNFLNAKIAVGSRPDTDKGIILLNNLMIIFEQAAAITVACVPSLRTSLRILWRRFKKSDHEVFQEVAPPTEIYQGSNGTTLKSESSKIQA